jgi:hypothetical protein
MAVFDPPQPLWKRNLAGILDFLLAFIGFGYPLSKIFGNVPGWPPQPSTGNTVMFGFNLGAGPGLVLLALIVAYFVVLGRTGGTVFQRLFGMTRVNGSSSDALQQGSADIMGPYDPPQPLWKRNLAGILDFVLVFVGLGLLFLALGFAKIGPPAWVPESARSTAPVGLNLQLWPALTMLALIIAYFVIFGRTGGTVFQRLFGMKKRAKAAVPTGSHD